MNPEELDQALHRSIGNVFQLHKSMIPILRSVLTSYPLKRLESMKKGELERLLYRLSNRKGVQEMRGWIDLEIESGEQKIDTVVYGLIYQTLENAGIISKEKLTNVRDYSSQEIWAYSCPTQGQEPKMIVRGQFHLDTNLEEKVVFTPYDVFYNDENLDWLVTGEKPILILDEDVSLREAAKLTVFEEDIGLKKARNIVKDLIRYMVKNYHRAEHKENDFQILRDKLILSLKPWFPTVIKENRAINYLELFNILRQVKRKNIDLYQYISDSEFVGKLTKGIEELISAPYAVVKSRIKQREKAFDKIIQSLYDLREKGYKGGPKEFRDLYGIRVVLPTVDDIFKYVNQLNNSPGVEVLVKKDFISEPKSNDYQSYHTTIRFAGIVYDLQIRTHEMDQRAEKDPKQAHHVYKDEIRERIQSTPLNVRKVISTCLGLFVPSE